MRRPLTNAEESQRQLAVFINRLKILSSIEGSSIGLEPHEAKKFNVDPYRYMRSMDIVSAAPIWDEFKKREPR